jgi:hypothetical protein
MKICKIKLFPTYYREVIILEQLKDCKSYSDILKEQLKDCIWYNHPITRLSFFEKLGFM